MQATLKAARLIIHLCIGLMMGAAVQCGLSRWIARERLVQWWNRVLLHILNIRLQVYGQPVNGAHMTVANHVSWLDIPLMAATEPTRFVSKSEVRHWPIAGMLANAAGTFYIRRGKGGARPLLEKLVPHLQAGGSIVIYPEGTTTDGRQVLNFHSRLFAAAVESGCLVQPVAIAYGLAADGRAIAPFIGDDHLLGHILRLLKEPQLSAQVHYLEPIRDVTGRARDELATLSQQQITDHLSREQPQVPFDIQITADWPDLSQCQNVTVTSTSSR